MAEIAYARRSTFAHDLAGQARQSVLVTDLTVADIDEPNRFELGIPVATRSCELVGLSPGVTGRLLRDDFRRAAVEAALADPGPHHVELTDDPGQAPRARLVTWEQSYYWDVARTAALPLGQVGPFTIVHHEEAACFAPALITEVLATRVDDARLVTLGYVQHDGLWWQADPVHHYEDPPRFSLRTGLARPDGATSTIEYDDDAMMIRATVDPVGNRTEAEIDYYTLQPWRLTDPNGNVSEVRYDALGVAVMATSVGHVGAESWGFLPLAQLPARSPATLAELLGDPAQFVQGAARYQWYDLDAWRRDGAPPMLAALARTELVNGGPSARQTAPTPTGSRYQSAISTGWAGGCSRRSWSIPASRSSEMRTGPSFSTAAVIRFRRLPQHAGVPPGTSCTT